MKELLRKEHYCYKIDRSLMENIASLPSIDNPYSPYALTFPNFTMKS